jgi:hypothetical protein
MERLSSWRAAAWLAFCLAAIATAAALLIPAGTKHHAAARAKPTMNATLVPRTHLFGQPVTATIDVPAGFSVKTGFAPYRVISRAVTKHGDDVRYRFVIDCLSQRCVGAPGTEREIRLPPATIGLPDGKSFVGYWPPLRQASRLAPGDLAHPELRGSLIEPVRRPPHDHRTLVGILLGVAAATAVVAAALVGLNRLAWRPAPSWSGPGRKEPSDLDYALLAAGLAAGGGSGDRRAALESLAVALERHGFIDLALDARGLAWSPRPPAGESVRRLAEAAQRSAKKVRAA